MERSKQYYGKDGPKVRLVPLSPADEKRLIEPTSEEIAAAQNLPYPSLLGVVQYPSCYTKIEIKYSMSVLSRWRTKWGPKHFAILLKALEYGYATRDMGQRNGRFCRCLFVSTEIAGKQIDNNESSGNYHDITTPFHDVRLYHAAELTEAHRLACKIDGFRSLMGVVRLRQNEPTRLHWDNQAAIQIAGTQKECLWTWALSSRIL